MAQSTAPRLRGQIFRLRRLAVTQPEFALDSILPEAMVQRVLEEEGAGWRRVVYTPWLTFWASFWQALGPDHSCLRRRQAVGNGLNAHHCFGRLRNRPKPVAFGEVACACWMAGGSAVG